VKEAPSKTAIIWEILRNISIKTLYFNFKYFDLKTAIKLPVLISRNVILKSTRGEVFIDGSIITGMILFGFGNVAIFDQKRQKAIWNVSGKITFNGKAILGHGTKISVEQTGEIYFGENFKITAETSIVSLKKIEFGKNCLISWDILIMDDDFHSLFNKEDGKNFPRSKPVYIGDNVWIGCRTTVLKGSYIPEHCIIGSNSVVNKKLEESNCVYAGNPLKIMKKNVDWEF